MTTTEIARTSSTGTSLAGNAVVFAGLMASENFGRGTWPTAPHEPRRSRRGGVLAS